MTGIAALRALLAEREDAAFIAAAREALPRLIDEVERLREHERTCVETASDEEITRQLREAVIDPVDETERAMTLVDGVLKWRAKAEDEGKRADGLKYERDEALLCEQAYKCERDEARAELERLQQSIDALSRRLEATEAQLKHAEVVIESQKRSYQAAHDRANDAEHNLELAEAVVDAARDQDGHRELCMTMQPYRGCTCGYEEVLKALAIYDAGRRK